MSTPAVSSYKKRALIGVNSAGLRTMRNPVCRESLSTYELRLLFKLAGICAVILLIPGLGSKRNFNLAWAFNAGVADWMSF